MYSIGEFSKLTGVAAGTLRYYEQYNIVSPKKDKQTNYRFYTDLDVRNVLLSRWYRSMGLTIEETKRLIDNGNKEEITNCIIQKKSSLENEKKFLELKISRIDKILSDLKLIDESFEKVSIEKFSSRIMIFQTIGNELIPNYDKSQIHFNLMNHLPFSTYACFFHQNKLYWGLSIEQSAIDLFDISFDSTYMKKISDSDCLVMVVFIGESKELQVSQFKPFKKYCEKHSIELTGEIYGELLMSDHSDCQGDYVKLYAIIK